VLSCRSLKTLDFEPSKAPTRSALSGTKSRAVRRHRIYGRTDSRIYGTRHRTVREVLSTTRRRRQSLAWVTIMLSMAIGTPTCFISPRDVSAAVRRTCPASAD
jgi:hypothetical protein